MSIAGRALLAGAIDLHVHAAPDVQPRCLDAFDAARAARDAGMTGLVLKDHRTMTADRAEMVRKVVPHVGVWGSVVLNAAVGGFNPEAVRAAIDFGAVIVWLPTNSASSHLRARGLPYGQGLSIFNEGLDAPGEIRTEVKEICKIVAEARVALATGHLHATEVLALLPLARQLGVEKMIVTHPENKAVALNDDGLIQAVREGAYLEFCCRSLLSPRSKVTAVQMASSIRRVGSPCCILTTDLGAMALPTPVDGMSQVVGTLLEQGITADDIRTMVSKNPHQILSH